MEKSTAQITVVRSYVGTQTAEELLRELVEAHVRAG